MNAPPNDREEPDSAPAAPPNRRKRRLLPRFGLRSLLIIGVVSSLAFGWIGKNLYRVRQEDAAIETLKQAGAQILVTTKRGRQKHPATSQHGNSSAASEFTSIAARVLGIPDSAPVTDVILSGDDPDDPLLHDALAALANLSRLEGVEFVGTAFDDASLDRLPALSNVTSVMCSRTAITGEGLAKLKKLPSLRRVAAGDFDARYKLVAGLSTLTELDTIHIYVQDVSREDVAALASLPKLKQLDLTHVMLEGSEILHPLSDAASIEELHLDAGPESRPLTAADIQPIWKLPNLRILTLGDADQGLLDAEVEVDSLRLLRLYGPAVDEMAARAFSAKHPDCLVAVANSCGVFFLLAGEKIDEDAAVEMEKRITTP